MTYDRSNNDASAEESGNYTSNLRNLLWSISMILTDNMRSEHRFFNKYFTLLLILWCFFILKKAVSLDEKKAERTNKKINSEIKITIKL